MGFIFGSVLYSDDFYPGGPRRRIRHRRAGFVAIADPRAHKMFGMVANLKSPPFVSWAVEDSSL